MEKLKRWAKVIGECLFALLLPWAYEKWEAKEREKILVDGLARIVSNFGMGSSSSSPSFKTELLFRASASKTLKKAGYVYKEYPQVPPDGDGWYIDR